MCYCDHDVTAGLAAGAQQIGRPVQPTSLPPPPPLQWEASVATSVGGQCGGVDRWCVDHVQMQIYS